MGSGIDFCYFVIEKLSDVFVVYVVVGVGDECGLFG